MMVNAHAARPDQNQTCSFFVKLYLIMSSSDTVMMAVYFHQATVVGAQQENGKLRDLMNLVRCTV